MKGHGGTARVGTSLIELIVVIAVLGVMAAVVGLSWRQGGQASESAPPPAVAAIEAARRQALSSGASVTVRVDAAGEARMVTALPDGRLLGAESLGFDALSGRRSDSQPEGVDRDDVASGRTRGTGR